MKKIPLLNRRGILPRGGWIAILMGLTSLSTWGNTDLDLQYRLKSIAMLPPTDQVGGILTQLYLNTLETCLKKHPRFILRKKASQTETLIQTHIELGKEQYFFSLQWLLKKNSLSNEVLASEHFSVPIQDSGIHPHTLERGLDQALERLFEQVPFFGTVTGRLQIPPKTPDLTENPSLLNREILTIDLGKNKITPDSILEIGTLESMEVHPLDHHVLSWKMRVTGKIQILEVDETISFGVILEESPTSKILPHQKILGILLPPTERSIASVLPSSLQKEPGLEEGTSSPRPMIPSTPFQPQWGWVAISPLLGWTNRDFYQNISGSSLRSWGLSYGAKVQSELWLNRSWFINLELRQFSWAFQIPEGETLHPQSVSFEPSLGYRFFRTPNLFGPQSWLLLGLHSQWESMPRISTGETGNLAWKNGVIGLGGLSPLSDPWSIFAQVKFRFFSSVTQKWISDSFQGMSDFEMQVGTSYEIRPGFSIRGSVFVESYFIEWTETHLAQKFISFSPSLLYVF